MLFGGVHGSSRGCNRLLSLRHLGLPILNRLRGLGLGRLGVGQVGIRRRQARLNSWINRDRLILSQLICLPHLRGRSEVKVDPAILPHVNPHGLVVVPRL